MKGGGECRKEGASANVEIHPGMACLSLRHIFKTYKF